jgi:broad specificity phosphatase PhoE
MLLPASVKANEVFSLYLVRHAEKAAVPKNDPDLSEKGHTTAMAFARYLQDKQVNRVFSTDTRRTMQTAGYFANPKRLLIQKYNARELERFAKLLLEKGETTYIVGHSNTTPTLIALLGGISNPIEEDEYGNMYQLTFAEASIKTTVLKLN